MAYNRKYLIDALCSIKFIKERHDYFAQDFVNFLGEKQTKTITNYYTKMLNNIKETLTTLPIGYRYQGTFYLRVPYSMPVEYEKITGSLFMRENLVSWAIESGGKKDSHYGYYRAAYKDAQASIEITRADCQAVHQEELKQTVV